MGAVGLNKSTHIDGAHRIRFLQAPTRLLAATKRLPHAGRRCLPPPPCALLGDSPASNKYRSRQDIEKAYYREWERITLLSTEERDRPMTVLTFLAFLPTWFQFYVVPGPVRFVAFLLAQRLRAVLYRLHKYLVLQGGKLDVALMQRGGISPAAPSRKLLLQRFHRHVPLVENIKYRAALLRGQRYAVEATQVVVPVRTPGPESERLPADEYDPSMDPWTAA